LKNRTINIYLVDVFAEEKYAGNQLAVVRNAGKLPDTEMQRTAREKRKGADGRKRRNHG